MKYKDSHFESDIKDIPEKELPAIAQELRDTIVDTVSRNGGHLASNLGVVELTIALHRVFDFTKDKLIFDVGHQSYVHKLLSDRVRDFGSIRQNNGLSGFQVRGETKYDFFGGGHSGTSLSAALGFAEANRLNGGDDYAVAVIGDGSFTNGMIHEALNNASAKDLKLLIILNDNEMSISYNVGGLPRYFGKLRTSVRYYRFKRRFKRSMSRMHLVGRAIAAVGGGFKNLVKRIVWKPNFFESLGLDYMGPVDGHDIKKLEAIFSEAKLKGGPTIIHVCTVKGKGYGFAEEDPAQYHSVAPFSPELGISDQPIDAVETHKETFTEKLGSSVKWYATDDNDIVAITAAMCDGTGLQAFKTAYSGRFFDVGIAEEHAMTFAAGLAAAGKKPIFALYSSFLQRCYDQLIHDVALQKLPVVIAVDHCGFVPGDGATHQGIFDCAAFLTIPEFTVYCAECLADIDPMLGKALELKAPVAIRYPKGTDEVYDRSTFIERDGYRFCELGSQNARKVCLISYGRTMKQLYKAAVELSERCFVQVFCITRVKPLNTADIIQCCAGAELIYFIEEQIKTGGVGEILLAEMAQISDTLPRFDITAVDGEFPKQGTIPELYDRYGMSSEKIAEHVLEVLELEASDDGLAYCEA